MYVIRLMLVMSNADLDFANRCFLALNKLYNTLVSKVRRLLNQMEHDKNYQSWLSEYRTLKKIVTPTDQDILRMEFLKESMNQFRKDIGLTKSGLESYGKVWRKRYDKLISSQQMQAEAARVYQSVESYLFKNGKYVRFRKISEVHTIGGKSNINGAKFDAETLTVNWLGHRILVKIGRKNTYLQEALQNPEIRYCQIAREPFRDGYHYYALVTLKGTPPEKNRKMGSGTMGIDPGVSTVAAVGENEVFLEELAPGFLDYEKRIAEVQRQMEQSKRDTNPLNFYDNGMLKPKEQRVPWQFSEHYYKLRWILRDLYRRKTAFIRQSHNILSNRLLAAADTFYVEKNDFRAMAMRSKKPAERSEKESTIKKKDGLQATVRKFKRKKRFGKSVGNRAPASLLTILKNKVTAFGGTWVDINPWDFKASQYCHDTGQYTKVPLSQRKKVVDGKTVQRDAYSAYLLQHSLKNGKMPDREGCIKDFEHFCKMQDEKISDMKASGISMKQCFGF